MHLRRWQRHGDPNILLQEQGGDPKKRFWSKVDKTATCWLWIGALDAHGYGVFWLDGKLRKAHRVSYEWQFGTIPVGLEPDHLCRTTACVKPDHLEPVSHQENIRRAFVPS